MVGHHYKYELLTARIRSEIVAGRFSGAILPGEADLMQIYGVSRRTLYHALTQLADEGLVRRVQRKGTVIVGREEGMAISRQAGLIMVGKRDHFVTPLYDAVMEALVNAGLFCVAMRYEPTHPDPDRCKASVENLHGLLSAPIRGLITSGREYKEHPFLEHYPKVNAVFLEWFDAAGKLPGKGAFVDYEQAGYLACHHLVEQGHRRIFLLTHRPASFTDPKVTYPPHHAIAQFETGYRRAMGQAGLAAFCDSACYMTAPNQPLPECIDRLRGLLTRPQRPTAIVCAQDSYAALLLHLAAELNLRVPEQLALVGVYDTPWSTQGPLSITTVNLQEDEIARQAVALLIGEAPPGTIVKITPQLLVRGSSQAPHAETMPA